VNVFDGWSDIYDKVYAWKSDDIQFYVDQARISGGPILELGCGTGRITIPIAMSGLEIIGLDSSGKMLETAKTKISKTPGIEKNIELIDGDMTTFSIDRQFSLIIIPFNGFLSLLTIADQRRCLENIKAHLIPDGRLIFDVFVPDLDTLTDNTRTAVHSWDTLDIGTGNKLVIWDQSRFDNYNQIMNVRMIIEELGQNGFLLNKIYRDFQLRYSHRFELQYLMELTGYNMLELYGNFSNQPIDSESTEMVWMLSPRL